MAKKKPAKAAKPAKADKLIYYFGKTRTDGRGDQKPLLGGKGANLAEMTSIGLPVPPGFTITTQCCDLYYKNGKKLPAGLMDDVRKSVATLEKETGKKFGDPKNPLLVSVRSGAAASMPGRLRTAKYSTSFVTGALAIAPTRVVSRTATSSRNNAIPAITASTPRRGFMTR